MIDELDTALEAATAEVNRLEREVHTTQELLAAERRANRRAISRLRALQAHCDVVGRRWPDLLERLSLAEKEREARRERNEQMADD